MLSPLLGVAAINSILFGVYGGVMDYFHAHSLNPSHSTYLCQVGVAGASAGFLQSFILSPTDLVKTRLQMQGRGQKASKELYRSPLDCIYKIYHREGIRRGVFRGQGITLLREVPSFGIYFVWYDIMSQFIANTFQPSNRFRAVSAIVSGGTTGMLCWLSTYPFDVVKSRIQADGIDGKHTRYNGIIDCFRKSYREEGLAVFGRGLLSCLIRAFPVNAATFLVVELVLWMNNSALDKRPSKANEIV
ncbi:mitochondrial basic amino acids transporter-like isoform X2 [Corticium candelabrum]|nr:mitochondrial basic amino acids transporter-like isoform X2 [Corticium candelabrum]XP_062502695.1 mitochondrial basic amino acids transporter-like isoform X2 [Corticium candelabrum]XP_062502696.1 mitochondrial basic amino acids transporter-like isoform X2 [Corticium candelabrum]